MCQLGDTRTLLSPQVSTQLCTDGVSVLYVSTPLNTTGSREKEDAEASQGQGCTLRGGFSHGGCRTSPCTSVLEKQSTEQNSPFSEASDGGPFEQETFRISKGGWLEGSLCYKVIPLGT